MRLDALPEELTAAEEKALAYGRAHLQVVAFIEQHLFEPLDLERIARVAGYSPWQFSRRFTRMQGESVMAYVRGQRLQRAAARLAENPDLGVLDVAIECGFESQAAFTRAFTRAFGTPPRRFGETPSPRPRRRRKEAGAPRLEQREEVLSELTLMGLRKRFTPANYVEFAQLWESLIAIRQSAGGSRRDESFGVIFERDPSGTLTYFAATRAWCRQPVQPVERLRIPSGRYIVLRHFLEPGPLLPQTTAAEEPLARVCEVIGATWSFQRYPENFAVASGWIDHYLPGEPTLRPAP